MSDVLYYGFLVIVFGGVGVVVISFVLGILAYLREKKEERQITAKSLENTGNKILVDPTVPELEEYWTANSGGLVPFFLILEKENTCVWCFAEIFANHQDPLIVSVDDTKVHITWTRRKKAIGELIRSRQGEITEM